MKNRKLSLGLTILVGIGVACVSSILRNKYRIDVTMYEVEHEKVETYERILHLTDFHNFMFQTPVLEKEIRKLQPNKIFITGDIIDNRHSREENKRYLYMILSILEGRATYLIFGNHDIKEGIPVYNDLLEVCSKFSNVCVLENETCITNTMAITGIQDTSFVDAGLLKHDIHTLGVFQKNADKKVQVVLLHRPVHVEMYDLGYVDFIFSGHVHGGQWKIPYYSRALISPDEGFFPKYGEGRMQLSKQTTLFISRGIGATTVRFRLFNPPEILVVDLKPKKKR